MTAFQWANQTYRNQFVPPPSNEQQVLMVRGDREPEFYDWCMEQAMGVFVIRTTPPMQGFSSTTCVVLPYRGFEDTVEATNEAYAMIKLAWKGTEHVRWEADDFVLCELP